MHRSCGFSCQLSVSSCQTRELGRAMAGDVWALKVFQRAYRLSLELHWASQGWPRMEQCRSSKSVCALLVEGGGRQPGSDAEFRCYVTMAIGSADEARLWCCYAA